MKYKLVKQRNVAARPEEAAPDHPVLKADQGSVVSSVILRVDSNGEVNGTFLESGECRDVAVSKEDENLDAVEELKVDEINEIATFKQKNILFRKMKVLPKRKSKMNRRADKDSDIPLNKISTGVAAAGVDLAAAAAASRDENDDLLSECNHDERQAADEYSDSPIDVSEAAMTIEYVDDDDEDKSAGSSPCDDHSNGSSTLDIAGDIYDHIQTDTQRDNYDHQDETSCEEYCVGRSFGKEKTYSSHSYDASTDGSVDMTETNGNNGEDTDGMDDYGRTSDDCDVSGYDDISLQSSQDENTELSLLTETAPVEPHAQNNDSGWFTFFYSMPTNKDTNASLYSSKHEVDGISSRGTDNNTRDTCEEAKENADCYSQQDPQEVAYEEFRQRMKKEKRKKMWRRLTLKKFRDVHYHHTRSQRSEKEHSSIHLCNIEKNREDGMHSSDISSNDGASTGSSRMSGTSNHSFHSIKASVPKLRISKLGAKLRKKFGRRKKDTHPSSVDSESDPSYSGTRYGTNRDNEVMDELSIYSSDLASVENYNRSDDEDGWATFLAFLGGDEPKTETRFCRA
jgi:hypothetical protein